MSTEQDEAAVDVAVTKIVGWMLDESDDIEGTCLRLTPGETGPWIHTTAQVQTWLRERLPEALCAALTTTTGSEAAIVRWPHDTTVSLCQVTHSGPECEVPCEHAHSRRVSRIHAGRIAALLAEHRLYGDEGDPYECGCGLLAPDAAYEEDFGELLWHETHVAEVLLHGATPTPAAEVGRREESGR